MDTVATYLYCAIVIGFTFFATFMDLREKKEDKTTRD